MMESVESTRVDRWLWSVRLVKTRPDAADAGRGGHVRVNGRPAKPATTVSPGDEVRALTTLLTQSEAVGASLGGTLRVFAEEMRKSRYLAAETKAAELPVKMAFPLVFCIFPCLTGVIFIPVAIQLFRTLFQT